MQLSAISSICDNVWFANYMGMPEGTLRWTIHQIYQIVSKEKGAWLILEQSKAWHMSPAFRVYRATLRSLQSATSARYFIMILCLWQQKTWKLSANCWGSLQVNKALLCQVCQLSLKVCTVGQSHLDKAGGQGTAMVNPQTFLSFLLLEILGATKKLNTGFQTCFFGEFFRSDFIWFHQPSTPPTPETPSKAETFPFALGIWLTSVTKWPVAAHWAGRCSPWGPNGSRHCRGRSGPCSQVKSLIFFSNELKQVKAR